MVVTVALSRTVDRHRVESFGSELHAGVTLFKRKRRKRKRKRGDEKGRGAVWDIFL